MVMIIDIEAKCKRLGIDRQAWSTVEDKVEHAISESWDGDNFNFSFDILPRILDEEELIAYIRWHNLHQGYPELFTWDGERCT
jgi:hypothetical protein